MKNLFVSYSHKTGYGNAVLEAVEDDITIDGIADLRKIREKICNIEPHDSHISLSSLIILNFKWLPHK